MFSQIKSGGKQQQKNFEDLLNAEQYYSVLKKIEMPGIGKGRFAQRLSTNCIKELIPSYVQDAIEYIIEQVTEEHE